MIDYFEVNKSNRATCRRCHQFIEDKMRGMETENNFGHTEHHYFCIKCSGEIIKQSKRVIQNLEEAIRFQMKKLTKEKV